MSALLRHVGIHYRIGTELFPVPLALPKNGDIVVRGIFEVLRKGPKTKTSQKFKSREIPNHSLPFMFGFWRMSAWSWPEEKTSF